MTPACIDDNACETLNAGDVCRNAKLENAKCGMYIYSNFKMSEKNVQCYFNEWDYANSILII